MSVVDRNNNNIAVGNRVMWLSRPRRGPGANPTYGTVEEIVLDGSTNGKVRVRAEDTNRLITISNPQRCEIQSTGRNTKRRKNATPTHAAKLVNKVKIVGDRSSSMYGLVRNAVDAFNNKVDELKRLAQEHGQDTYLSLRLFNSHVDHSNTIDNQFIHGIQPITLDQWRTGGMTALLDAVGVAIHECEQDPDFSNTNVSYIIEVITDGDENVSRRQTWRSLARLIRNAIATDRFTFVFSVPRGAKANIVRRLGIPDGCVQEWEQTSEGVQTMNASANVGYDHLYTSRSLGKTSVTDFFRVDMSQVDEADIDALPDVSRQYTRLPVSNEDSSGRPWQIRTFVEDRIQRRSSRSLGSRYATGNAYYQLTKTETVQANKDILVRRKSDGKVFGGNDARRVIGMPLNTEVLVKPGNFGDYDIFIKSTSVNRKLVRGTDVLYRKP